MLNFASVAVVVRDEKKAMAWYKDTLGFRVLTEFDHWVTVAPKGANVVLHLCPDAPPEPGNTGIGFTTKDAAKEEGELRGKGVTITTPTTKEDWGTYFQFADPEGNVFWVVEE